MLTKMVEYTPMMQQYMRIKAQHQEGAEGDAGAEKGLIGLEKRWAADGPKRIAQLLNRQICQPIAQKYSKI